MYAVERLFGAAASCPMCDHVVAHVGRPMPGEPWACSLCGARLTFGPYGWQLSSCVTCGEARFVLFMVDPAPLALLIKCACDRSAVVRA